MIGANNCRVGEGPWGEVIETCKCKGEFNDDDCQLKYHPTQKSFACKPSANKACKSAVTVWAEAYRNASNANDPKCKDQDPNYKASQDADNNCNSAGMSIAYSFFLAQTA